VRHDGAFARIKPAPLVGENASEVLGNWLDLSPEQISKYQSDGVI
jgi:hypothetical protein